MHLVLDTNIIVGFSMKKKGAVVELWRLWMEKQFTLATTDAILAEVQRAIVYPQIQARHNWSAARIQVFLSTVRYKAEVYPGTTPVHVSPTDTTDAKFLVCALEAHATALVTGDDHLLDLRRYKGIPIVTPAECLKRYFPDAQQ